MPKGKKGREAYAKCKSEYLNFHFESRHHERSTQQHHSRSQRSSRSNLRQHKADTYITSRFKFCLSSSSKASSLVGQDASPWADVSRVILETETEVSCPICLGDVVAPRMTKCGHVFCWLCITRLFTHAKDVWDSCPLCFSLIQLQDIRRVHIIKVPKVPEVGKHITFDLVQRFASCIVSSTVKSKMPPFQDFTDLPLFPGNTETELLSRLYRESKVSLLESMQSERLAIESGLAEAAAYGDELGVVICESMKSQLSGEVDALEKGGEENAENDVKQDIVEEPVLYLYQFRAKNVFLHPFNVQCLRHQYQDMKYFPEILENVGVLDTETFLTTPETIKRYAFLRHMPELSTVTFVEVDLGNYLNTEWKEKLKEDISKRHKKREKKRRLQKKVEKSKMKSFQREWFDQLATYDASLLPRNINTGYELTDPVPEAVNVTPSIDSFATIVNSNGYFPALEETASLSKSASPPKSRSAWGTTAWGTPAVDVGAKVGIEQQQAKEENASKTVSTGRRNNSKGKKVSLFSNSQHRVYR